MDWIAFHKASCGERVFTTVVHSRAQEAQAHYASP